MKDNLVIPNHIAVIMDGNSRWAKQRLLPKIKGYKQGAIAAENIIDLCEKYGVQYLTLFAFSSENWSRPKSEINILMKLLKRHLIINIQRIHKKDIKIIFIGDHSKLPEDINKLMQKIMKDSERNKKMTLIVAISYGGRDQIRKAAVDMVKAFLGKNNKDKGRNKDIKNSTNIIDIENIKFDDFLDTKNIPDPDLLIRTSGEKRISNFLLWQLAYTELYFTNTLWPDFDEKCLLLALKNFTNRERRYGK